eukprot:Hpha_TRINITY_DN34891_c0_g1::TRINITY_DN34891_c0_g1_i1::g.167898::m.167898
MARAVLRRFGGSARVIGVRYNDNFNVEEVYSAICPPDRPPPSRVLMESFNCPCETDIDTGDLVPYADVFTPAQCRAAAEAVRRPDERQKWTGEAVAVMAALKSEVPIYFCDRDHEVSFTRLCSRLAPSDLPVLLRAAANGVEDGPVQNALCPFFNELWSERHRVMSAVMARAVQSTAKSEGGEVVLIVGEEHCAGVQAAWEQEDEGGGEAERERDLRELLTAPDPDCFYEGDPELRARCAIAALLVATGAFPPSVVLPPPHVIEDEGVRKEVTTMYAQHHDFVQQNLGPQVAVRRQQRRMQRMDPNRVRTLADLSAHLAGETKASGTAQPSGAGIW